MRVSTRAAATVELLPPAAIKQLLCRNPSEARHIPPGANDCRVGLLVAHYAGCGIVRHNGCPERAIVALDIPTSTNTGATGKVRCEASDAPISGPKRGIWSKWGRGGLLGQLGLQQWICLSWAWTSSPSVAARVEPPNSYKPPISDPRFLQGIHINTHTRTQTRMQQRNAT